MVIFACLGIVPQEVPRFVVRRRCLLSVATSLEFDLHFLVASLASALSPLFSPLSLWLKHGIKAHLAVVWQLLINKVPQSAVAKWALLLLPLPQQLLLLVVSNNNSSSSKKRLSAQSRTAFGAAILCLMLPQTGCNSPPPSPLPLRSSCGSISWPLWRVSSALFVVD